MLSNLDCWRPLHFLLDEVGLGTSQCLCRLLRLMHPLAVVTIVAELCTMSLENCIALCFLLLLQDAEQKFHFDFLRPESLMRFVKIK